MTQGTALLIIDVQLGMYEESDPVYRGEELLHTIGALIAKARADNAPVIYVQHSEAKGYPLHPEAPGWPIHPAIAPQEGDAVVHKRYPDSFQETDLQRELEAREIKHLVIAGIQTEYCVDTTCRRAFSLGYDVTLVQDGHSTWDSRDLQAAQIIAHHNTVLGGWFVKLKPASAIEFEGERAQAPIDHKVEGESR
jgi:nicotinamidase-related amidase